MIRLSTTHATIALTSAFCLLTVVLYLPADAQPLISESDYFNQRQKFVERSLLAEIGMAENAAPLLLAALASVGAKVRRRLYAYEDDSRGSGGGGHLMPTAQRARVLRIITVGCTTVAILGSITALSSAMSYGLGNFSWWFYVFCVMALYFGSRTVLHEGARLRVGEIGTALNSGERDTILYLRRFAEDDRPVVPIGVLPTFVTVEDVIIGAGVKLGRVIALHNSTSYLAGKSVQVSANSDDWQSKVIAEMERAKVIIVVLAPSDGLMWEIHQLVLRGCLGKTIVFIPPIGRKAMAQRWLSFLRIYSQSGANATSADESSDPESELRKTLQRLVDLRDNEENKITAVAAGEVLRILFDDFLSARDHSEAYDLAELGDPGLAAVTFRGVPKIAFATNSAWGAKRLAKSVLYDLFSEVGNIPIRN